MFKFASWFEFPLPQLLVQCFAEWQRYIETLQKTHSVFSRQVYHCNIIINRRKEMLLPICGFSVALNKLKLQAGITTNAFQTRQFSRCCSRKEKGEFTCRIACCKTFGNKTCSNSYMQQVHALLNNTRLTWECFVNILAQHRGLTDRQFCCGISCLLFTIQRIDLLFML